MKSKNTKYRWQTELGLFFVLFQWFRGLLYKEGQAFEFFFFFFASVRICKRDTHHGAVHGGFPGVWTWVSPSIVPWTSWWQIQEPVKSSWVHEQMKVDFPFFTLQLKSPWGLKWYIWLAWPPETCCQKMQFRQLWTSAYINGVQSPVYQSGI